MTEWMKLKPLVWKATVTLSDGLRALNTKTFEGNSEYILSVISGWTQAAASSNLICIVEKMEVDKDE